MQNQTPVSLHRGDALYLLQKDPAKREGSRTPISPHRGDVLDLLLEDPAKREWKSTERDRDRERERFSTFPFYPQIY